MTQVKILDRVTLGGTRITSSGYLVADARIARTGIQIYTGREVGKPELTTVRVYRPENEVFDRKALATFAHLPVTVDHPAKINSANWRKHSVGMTGDEVARDGEFVRIPLTLMDKSAIEKVNNGKRELSAGYSCDIEFESGVAPDGQPYDAVQKNIVGNHLAVVTQARAGSSCRIGDSWATSPLTGDENMKTVIVDGASIEVSDEAATAIDGLQKQIRDANAIVGARDGEIASLRSKVPDAMALDSMIADRSLVIDLARSILGGGYDPQGEATTKIRRKVVEKRLGNLKDRDDAYVNAAFDAITADVSTTRRPNDPVRDVIMDGVRTRVNDVAAAYDSHCHFLENAWRPENQQYGKSASFEPGAKDIVGPKWR